jgi:YVTN family beta-propeller protein
MMMQRIMGLVMMGGLLVPAFGESARLLVIEKGAHSLGIVDPASGALIASVPEDAITGHEVTASPDGKFAYVPIYGNSGVGKPGTDGSSLLVIDVASHKVVGHVDFGHGVRPHLPTFGPKDGMLYVTTELDKSVTIIDPKTLKIVGSIPTGQAESHMLAISHNGSRGYTANVGPGTVSVLDMQARKTLAVIPVAAEVQRISVSMDDSMVFTSDQNSPRLAVIDTATNTVKHWVSLPGIGYGSMPTRDGRWLLLTMTGINKLAVIDLKTFEVAKTIDMPKGPVVVYTRPDGKTAYVSCEASSEVAELDLSDWKVKRTIATGKGSDGLAWAQGN